MFKVAEQSFSKNALSVFKKLRMPVMLLLSGDMQQISFVRKKCGE